MIVRSRLLGMVVAAGVTAASADGLSLVPSNPGYLETVYARITPPPNVFVGKASVSMTGNLIEVRYQFIGGIGQGNSVDVKLGSFPGGSYRVRLTGVTTLEEASFGVPFAENSVDKPESDFSGPWWNPAESGWGLHIAQGPTRLIFAEWFHYGPNSQPVWYTLQPGRWIGDYEYEGPIIKTTGPALGGAFDSSRVTETVVGTGTLLFRADKSARFTYAVEGISGAKDIVRLPIQ